MGDRIRLKIFGRFMYVLLSVLLFCIGNANGASQGGYVRIDNGKLLRDNAPWIPKGFTFEAFVAPNTSVEERRGFSPEMQEKLRLVSLAHAKFSEKSISSAMASGASVIRFQISQPGLDPRSKIYRQNYVKEIVDAVTAVRRRGLTVILSMHHGEWSGLTKQGGYPSASTKRAWQTIAPFIKNDMGVIMEVFNEPGGAGEEKWEKWQRSHQELIDYIRMDLGAKNVLVVHGLKGGRELEGMPRLVDKLGQMAFGVHPYIGSAAHDSPEEFEKKWGWLTSKEVVIVTEWNALGRWPGCSDKLPKAASALLKYLKEKRLGLIGWAFDVEGTIYDKNGAPTDFKELSCDISSNSGAGKLILDFVSE
jgi:endoglucanase